MADLPKLPGIPSVSTVSDASLANILRPIKENLDILQAVFNGTALANGQYVTSVPNTYVSKLGGSGTLPNGVPVNTSTGYDPTTDYTPPPIPLNVAAVGAFTNIFVTWNKATYRNHAYTEVWRSTTAAFSGAVLIGSTPGAMYTDPVGTGQTYYYWVRFVSQANVAGPYNSSGVLGQTSQDPAYLLNLLNGAITSSQLNASLSSRINLIDAPSTVAGSVNSRLAYVQGQVNTLLQIPSYSNTTTYIQGQQVQYNGGLYAALQSTTGNLPTNPTYWQKIGDYTSLGDAVAAHSTQITNLQSGLGQEIIDRNTLATQLRGSYNGTDLSQITSGLIYQESVARAAADSSNASTINSVAVTMNTKTAMYFQVTPPTGTIRTGDVWVDIGVNYSQAYFSSDYATLANRQYRWDGSQWVPIPDYQMGDNYAAIVTETNARVTADTAFAQQLTTLTATVSDNQKTLNAAITAEATARSTADSSLASSITSVSATANSKVKTYAQSTQPASSPTVTLNEGDLWVDTSSYNKLYRYTNGAWAAVNDSSALQSWITSTYSTDVSNIQSQVDQKIESWFQSADPSTAWTSPAVQAIHVGDLWYDSTNKVLKRYISTTSGSTTTYSWSTIQDATAIGAAAAAAAAQTTADSKITTYATNSAPSNASTGDIWIDTGHSNAPYRWDGSTWASIQDGAISSVAARVTTVETSKIGYATLNATGEVFDNGGTILTATDVTAWNTANPNNQATWHIGVPFATAVKQVYISDGNNTAALEQRFTAQRSLNGQLTAQYYVKTDVAGHVAGFGLYNDATTGSMFGVQANRFYVAPAVDFSQESQPGSATSGQFWYKPSTNTTYRYNGTAWISFTNPSPFVVQTTDTTISGVSVPAGVYIDTAFIVNGSITNAKIASAAIDDAKISSLSADKITFGSLDGTLIKAGTVTADKIGTGTLAAGTAIYIGGSDYTAPLVLTGDGQIVSNGTDGGKARFFSGNVEIYKNVPNVGSVLYKALSRVEFGQANNNALVTIPGYFKSQPNIIVSPANLQMFSAAYSGQNQSIQCQATGITQTAAGSMVWQFTPVATLSLSANTGNTVINETSGSTSATTWYSSQYTTPANTTTITPSVTIASNRGNGSSQYYYRSVRWRVEYYSGGSWVTGSFVTTALSGSTSASATTTQTFTFPSSGTWTFRIYAEAYDTDGTVFGSVAYNYRTDTASRSDTQTVQSNFADNFARTLNYTPTYSVPSGWTLASVSFTYHYSYQVASSQYATATISGGGIYYSGNSSGSNLTKTWSTSSNSLVFTLNVQYNTFFQQGSSGYLTLTSATGTYNLQQVQANSTTPNDTFQLNSYSYALTSAQVLATGSLNWIAVGD